MTAWRIASRPSADLSVGFLTLGGFCGGGMFWGAFNTALEFTNTEQFCVSCREMQANSYESRPRIDALARRRQRRGGHQPRGQACRQC